MQEVRIAILCVLILLLVAVAANAHRPVIVKEQSSREKPVLVKEPEISYAYYGRLAGEPHYYKISSSESFNLYVNILVPDLSPKTQPVTRHDISFQVLEGEKPIFTAEGNDAEWKRFYEKYGRDHYYMGPEFEQEVSAGTYYVRVFNKDNTGKYALAIGKQEKFTFLSLIRALFRARSLDKWFFK